MKQRYSNIAAFATALGVVSAAHAQSEAFKTACAKPGDERIIEIVSPGKIGAACDVQYTYVASKATKVPYHANNSADFCAMKAQDLVADLASQGYACAPTAGVALAAAPEAAHSKTGPEPAPIEELAIVETPLTGAGQNIAASAPRISTLAPDAALSKIEPEPAKVQIEALAPEKESVVNEPAPTQAARSNETSEHAPVREANANDAPPADIPSIDEPIDALGEKLKDVLEQPASPRHAAVRGPADLTDKAEPNIRGAGRSPVVGRLVGAEPANQPAPEVELAAAEPAPDKRTIAPRGATPVTEAAVQITPAPPATASQVASQITTTPASVAKISSRKPADVIRATLDAQAAAWNEGNLDAFMETYWKSDDLKFISGTTITKGWSATMKRYRKRYVGGDGFGVLEFNKMDVEMVTDDVAVVTGRFEHAKQEDQSRGVFSLVMKRNGGAWRIVHDHTAVDDNDDG